MFDFGKGMIFGVMAGIGISLLANPVSKRDMKMMKRRARRALCSITDAADGLMCKIK